MAEVSSTFRLEPGAAAPDFTLPDGIGAIHSLADLAAGRKAVVLIFACNHCPFVVHLADALGLCARDYEARDVGFIAVNANDVANYPADAPAKMTEFARSHDWKFPYLYDETQQVAKAYAAACTPDFYVFGGDLKLAYAGQFDSTRPGRGEPAGENLRAALDQVLRTGSGPAPPWPPSSGCNIKWKAGNAPDYF